MRDELTVAEHITAVGDTDNESERREMLTREFDRDPDFSHTNNHAGAVASTPAWQGRLRTLDIPTMVVHGDEDPILQYRHGQPIAELIPGATLLKLEGAGHEMPRGTWGVLVPALINHTGQAN